MSDVRLEWLLGTRVLDRGGRPIGRLEEVRADRDGEECVVTEYLIGAAALVERLSAPILRAIGLTGPRYAARWDQLDLSDPQKPRLTCGVDELRTVRIPRPREKEERARKAQKGGKG
jgi:hypothetical protein